MRKLTLKEVKREISQNTHCEVISTEYRNSKTKLKFRCECGNEFENTLQAMRVRNKQYCNECSKRFLHDMFAKTQYEFEKEVNDVLGDNYKVLTQYVNVNTNVLVKHLVCGYE